MPEHHQPGSSDVVTKLDRAAEDSTDTSPMSAGTDVTRIFRRSPSIETTISDNTHGDSLIGADLVDLPAPPYNSPEPSIAGDRTSTARELSALLSERLATMPYSSINGDFTTRKALHFIEEASRRLVPTSPAQASVNEHDQSTDAPMPGNSRFVPQRGTIKHVPLYPDPFGHQLLHHSDTDTTKLAKIKSATLEKPTIAKNAETYEHNTWADLAEEDLTRALARVAMLAKDENQKSEGKISIEAVYSRTVAKILGAAEITFDLNYLVKYAKEA